MKTAMHMIRHHTRTMLVALVLLCAATGGEGEIAPDAHSLLRRFDEMYESSGTMALVEIEITRPGKTRSLRMRSWSKGADKDPPGPAVVPTARLTCAYLPHHRVSVWYHNP